MSRERPESGLSSSSDRTINTIANDDTPLYYCDRNLKPCETTRNAERTLYIVSCLTVIFIVIEFIGGFLANSLAVMTDAGHMVSDLMSFIVSILAIKLARRPPTNRFHFGFHRAEVLGALVSVLMVWTLTVLLVYAAVERIRDQNFELESTVMLITAVISVLFNLIMGGVLYVGKAPHSHFGSHSHHDKAHKTFPVDVEKLDGNEKKQQQWTTGMNTFTQSNINIRAAFIHVLGDLVQSLGVLIAAIIIKYTGYHLADPICTFLFSALVMMTTYAVMRDTLAILMEAAPKHMNIDELDADFRAIEGVQDVHSLRVWSLTIDRIALSVHLETDKECDTRHVVHKANQILKIKHGITYISIQVTLILYNACAVATRSIRAIHPPGLLRRPDHVTFERVRVPMKSVMELLECGEIPEVTAM